MRRGVGAAHAELYADFRRAGNARGRGGFR
jgi:hypothetical protein